jgi:subtilisin family serine protease
MYHKIAFKNAHYLITSFFFLLLSTPIFADSLENLISNERIEQQKKSNIRAGLFQVINKKKRLDHIIATEGQTKQWVLIDAIAKGDPDILFNDLQTLGIRSASKYGRFISGQLPLEALDKLKQLTSLNEVKQSKIITSQGSAVSIGDRAQRSNFARENFNVSGKGITIAVLSDSYNCLKGAAKDQKTKDLPKNVLVRQEALDCNAKRDEGRALMQIIHDVAPNATLIFQSGDNGLATTANAILDLAFKNKADIIIDDIKSLEANFFQKDALTEAVERVVDAGVVYITAAGNSGRNSYQTKYNAHTSIGFSVNAHDFDSSDNVDIFQTLKIAEGSAVNIILQWDSPAYSISGGSGAQTDLDIFLFNQKHDELLAASIFGNIGRDPVEILQFFNPLKSGKTKFDLMITKAAGNSEVTLKYIILNNTDGIIQEYGTKSGGLFGHANSISAITVGAANSRETPSFGISPPLLQHFSSAGGLAIKRNKKGERLNPPFVAKKPDIVGPDNVNTTFFGTQDTDNDGLPNILGSSAAAPHIAGVVALLLEANNKLQPADVKAILQKTAIDITKRNDGEATLINNGFDFDSGFGLVNAEAAVDLAENYIASKASANAIDNRPITVNNTERVGSGGISLFILFFMLLFSLYTYYRRLNIS